jgi:hypothetical protein
MTDGIRVHCPRIERLRVVAEHIACPYCHGRACDVEAGDRRRFCDYDRARDPLVFGFPENISRFRDG